ncbi:MAG TPA: cytochrome c oxidase subunit 4 [Candidatus Limnocylindrales bacterium]|jgi:plastocyanin
MIEELWSSLIHFTSQFVIPDWGALIALLPVLLAIPVVLYVTWTIYRFVTAGPTRRGKRRLPPVTPEGIHMPGPSFAPLLAAAGTATLVFGLVVGGIWLLVGLAVLTITLLYWGREALRDYDAIPSASGEAVAVGMLPAPAGTPPEGVHIPPPSFRPILIAISLTMLVAGLVVGGWALFLGLVALVITLLGWLWDSRKEYHAVEEADRTGHLDMGGAPAWPKATFAAIAVLVAFAVLFSSGVLPNAGGDQAGVAVSPAPGGGGAAPPAASAGPSLPAADVTLAAANIDFSPKTLSVPAGKAFTLAFDNQDPVPHNVVIKDAGGTVAFTGEIVTGPHAVVYDVPALAAGSYTFVCTVHPNMTGSITAQ